MASIHPFRAVRPKAADAARIAAVPYDVVNTEEARALASGNTQSFLHVSRAEIDLPEGTDPYSDSVYEKAVRNFQDLRPLLIEEDRSSLYFHRLRMGSHEQTGLAACYSLDEYDRDLVKKHERTRLDKENDRTRHMIALGAQTGPVFLTYRAASEINNIAGRVCSTDALKLYDFKADDGIEHAVWRVGQHDADGLVEAFSRIPALYIADGHHRAASAARARHHLRAKQSDAGAKEFDTFLAVAFPDTQVRILPYNRTVKDLAGLSVDAFLAALRERFTIRDDGVPVPVGKGDVSMYVAGKWYTVVLGTGSSSDRIGSLDVSVLQDRLLAPVLKIADARTDKRIDFVGGIRGTAELERAVESGRAAVAFSMFPVTANDLMGIADAGAIMPPKSTWFEPKLRDGLLIHQI